MATTLIARSEVRVHAPASRVWAALTDPAMVSRFMLGMEPVSSWSGGAELRWIGRHQGRTADEAWGRILAMEPPRRLQYTFYYPGYGFPDQPRWYNTVTWLLRGLGQDTLVRVEQGDFSVFPEGASFAAHSQAFWDEALKALKALLEAPGPANDI